MSEVRCEACGEACDEDAVVGKTTVRNRGKITVYNVISCKCGNIFKGELISESVSKRFSEKDKRGR